MQDFDVDLFVIGAGSGGVRAARVAAGYGARVMVAEEYRVGGTCVIRGCVPKKLLVYASRFSSDFADSAGFGWTLEAPTFDWSTLIANKDREIARIESVYVTTLERAGVVIARERAVLEDAHTVRLLTSGRRLRTKYVLISTGARPDMGVQIPGVEHAISSNEVFNLPSLPRRVLIKGGGYIAVEFAGIFAGLGSQVTLVYRGENILRGFDDEARTHLRSEMESHGIRVLTGCTVAGIEVVDHGFRVSLSDGSMVEVEQTLFAIGRRPNVADFGLEKIGVALAKNEGVAVDAFSQSSIPHIYAVGDVTNRVNLTPVAIREGHAFADTVFGGRPTAVDHLMVPTAVFSDPEMGAIGMTEQRARAELPRVDIYKTIFKPLKATLSGRKTRMFMKLIVDGSNDRVMGCHIVGDDAAEMIQLVAVAVRMRATKADFDATIAVHPTVAEELVTLREPTARYVGAAAE